MEGLDVRHSRRIRPSVRAAVRLGLVLLLAAGAACAGPVISWVAPYKIAASKDMLQRDFGGVGMKDGLTWLALQFWITDGPDLVQDGNVAGAGFDGHVKWFRDWGRANGVKVTLCVTDYVGGWNWAEARRSFLDNRAAFVRSLVAEVERLELDGVELDLEGLVTPTSEDMTGFVAFAKELSEAMHAKGKAVTVASFAAQWNAPNWTWWPALTRSVDGVTSMGYEEAGKGSTHGFNYAEQKKRAGRPEKLMIGMPGHMGQWQGHSVEEQLDWVVADGTVGVGIWECSLPDAAWQTAGVWNKLKAIRAARPAALPGAQPGLRREARPGLRGRGPERTFDLRGIPVLETERGGRAPGLRVRLRDGEASLVPLLR